ncbi:MAG: serine/threonine protein phosphatase [Acetobacteraceae bacterium]|nr:serine/threonine protein phosphatase [Acetobacteraceae bacterium]MBV8523873.1 serine/threonine protein phosphatase [Acetobacteraceae bacterium]
MLQFTKAPASLANGHRIYAIGDVHGCATVLTAMHDLIAKDCAQRPTESVTIIHLGDYIDRGPDSAGVLDFLIAGPHVPGVRWVNLRGNHEQMALSALYREWYGAGLLWLANGGRATLDSWRVPPGAQRRNWIRHVPALHLRFLEGLELFHQVGSYLFVHAGLRPGTPLEQQSAHDLLWIRDSFLFWKGDFGAIVVHGHTPSAEPVVRPNRIGIDTGLVFGGRLTCVVLESDQLAFLSVQRGARPVQTNAGFSQPGLP